MKAISENKKELLVYTVLWGILFVTPVLSIYFHTTSNSSLTAFPWNSLFMVWRQCLIFFVIFLLHNFLLAPLLVYRRRRLLYFSSVAAVVALFIVVQCASRPDHQQRHHPPHEQQQGQDRLPHDDFFLDDHPEGHEPPAHSDWEDGHHGPRHHEGMQKPPGIMAEHDMVSTIILVLMIGMNLGIKLYFRQQKEQQTLALMKQQNLEQQLEYLKYQINPHFLMNTLNNIHALVDIDPEQAKETIVELSKIMRFVLYEGSKQKVPLRQELIFLENYIELMKMRVAERVDISVTMPDMLPDREIPPLMLITFVENAFKHGVSYRQKSFIDIRIDIVEDHLCFECRNSKVPQGEDRHGGVGLQNVKRRLELIYGNAYVLDIDDGANTYTVSLQLPL